MRLLGHPLHPMLVHFPIACWGFASLADVLCFFGYAHFWPYAGGLIALGLVMAIPAMAVGVIDLISAPDFAQKDANMHMSLMILAFIIYLFSLMLRLEGTELSTQIDYGPVLLSVIGFVFMAIGGWYGGQLVYTHGVGARSRDRQQ